MPLTKDQIQNLYEKPKRAEQLANGQRDNERLSFHTRISTSAQEAGPYWSRFLSFLSDVLKAPDKEKRIESLINFPVESSLLVDKATDEINAFFKAEDRYLEVNFSDDELQQDFETYLNAVDFQKFLENDLFTQCLGPVNAIAVIDLPAMPPIEGRVTPFWYFIEFGNLKDIDVDRRGQVLYAIWEVEVPRGDEKDKYLVCVDDGFYHTLKIEQGVLTNHTQNPHGLTYCPACFIWHDVKNAGSIERKNAVLPLLSKLDKLILEQAGKEYSDLYAQYPILWQYLSGSADAEEAKYEIEYADDLPAEGLRTRIDQPEKKQSFMGPGTQVDMIQPQFNDSGNDFQVPVGFANAEPGILEYNATNVKSRADQISFALTGIQPVTNKDAVNEDQVRSQYESRRAVLKYWAENFERTDEFLRRTIAKLRYGSQFESITVNYGDDFFLIDKETALAEYQDAKNAGVPQYILSLKREQLEKVESKNNSSRERRIKILSELEPYPDQSLEKVPLGTDDYVLKARFDEYIKRFERENGPLDRFGILLDWNTRITTIKQTLNSYVSTDELRKFGQEQIARDDARNARVNQRSVSD